MANTLDSMDLKQIISLHGDGSSNRKISATPGIARNTVNNYIRAFKTGDHTFKELLAWDYAILEAQFTSIDNQRFEQLARYFERMNKAKNHSGFTFLHHYQEYMQQVKNPYGYTQFMGLYHRKYPPRHPPTSRSGKGHSPILGSIPAGCATAIRPSISKGWHRQGRAVYRGSLFFRAGKFS